MHEEYGDLDSDYVLVKLWGGQVGRAMSYPNVVDIVARTRARILAGPPPRACAGIRTQLAPMKADGQSTPVTHSPPTATEGIFAPGGSQ